MPCAALFLIGALTLVSAACTPQGDSCGGLGPVSCFEKCVDDLRSTPCGFSDPAGNWYPQQCDDIHAERIGEACSARCLECNAP